MGDDDNHGICGHSDESRTTAIRPGSSQSPDPVPAGQSITRTAWRIWSGWVPTWSVWSCPARSPGTVKTEVMCHGNLTAVL